MTTTTDERMDRIAESLATLSAKIDFIAEANVDTREILLGTAKTGGLKERLAIAEEDIKRNKESWGSVNASIKAQNDIVDSIGKTLDKLATVYNAILWIATVGGGAILVGILTGKIVISFP